MSTSFVRILVCASAYSLCLATGFSQSRAFSVSPLISDNMVLQQKSKVPFWGRGGPGSQLSLQASWGGRATTRVQADSSWFIRLSTPRAGGPYELIFRYDDSSFTIRNVLVGEVWLCSGQSNMEMPLAGWPPGDTIMNAQEEIKNASYSAIRVFAVRRAYSAVPESSCDGNWEECSPAAAGDFSATAYFFGRKLYESLRVPIGLITSSWGGTSVDSWMRAEYLSRFPQYDSTLQKLRESVPGLQRFNEWLRAYPVIDMKSRKGEARWKEISFNDEQCSSVTYNDSGWHDMELPRLWETTQLGELDGAVWFRRQVSVPREWLHNDLILELGPIDDIDITYVNGTKVGSHEGEGMYKADRIYRVAGFLVDTTVLHIAVRVIDYQGGGGMFGDPQSMSIHPEASSQRVSLAGTWKYVPVALYQSGHFSVFGPIGNQYDTRPRLPIDVSAYTPTTLYNAMIHPVIPFSIRGAIWYQGEADTKRPKEYSQLFPLLIKNWRNDFRLGDFPFYYVQIAPFEYDSSTHSQYLRESQTAALSVRNTGMAVTLDIGNPKSIHPADKQDVGSRLAVWALAKTYKKEMPYSGPLCKSIKKRKGSIDITFEHARKGLMLKQGIHGNGFQIAGSDRVFKDATVKVRGGTLIVSHPEIQYPQSVRYAFTNAPEATLFNVEGLPAPSFRTDDWE